jgi:hypothetical protein
MPEITCSGVLQAKTFCQLSNDSVNAVAHTPQDAAVLDAPLLQRLARPGQPIVAVSQLPASGSLGQVGNRVPSGDIGRSQGHGSNDARPAQLQLQAKAVAGLSGRRIPTLAARSLCLFC